MAILYQPSYMLPQNTSIDSTLSQTFSCLINGNICVGYTVFIRKNSDNTIIYNPVKVDISATPLYNQDTLLITIPANTCTNGTDYKWEIQLYYDSTNYVTSFESYFKCRKTPTLTTNISATPTINTKNYTLTGTYSQEQSVPIKYFQWYLYDSNQKLIKEFPKTFSANIKATYDGFLSDTNYYGRLLIENQDGVQIDSGLLKFSVSYAKPNLNLKPTVTQLTDKNAIQVGWSFAYVIPAKYTGTSPYYELTPDILYTDDKSAKISSGNTIYYDTVNSQSMSFTNQTTDYLMLNLQQGFTGTIYKKENTVSGDSYTISYDGTQFNYSIVLSGVTTSGSYVDASATGDMYWWKITALPDSVQFKKLTFNVLVPSDTLYPLETIYPFKYELIQPV